jgi:hypothetical protein
VAHRGSARLSDSNQWQPELPRRSNLTCWLIGRLEPHNGMPPSSQSTQLHSSCGGPSHYVAYCPKGAWPHSDNPECVLRALSVLASIPGQGEAWTAKYPRTYADSRLARASIFSAVIELRVRHSSATIPLRVSLFLSEILSFAKTLSVCIFNSLDHCYSQTDNFEYE